MVPGKQVCIGKDTVFSSRSLGSRSKDNMLLNEVIKGHTGPYGNRKRSELFKVERLEIGFHKDDSDTCLNCIVKDE